MIFDDYELREWQGETMLPMSRPEIAIDAFIGVFQPRIEVLYKGWQVVIRKKYAMLNKKLSNGFQVKHE